MTEKIHHPKHYNEHPSGVEAIELCEHLGFNIGNAVKYLFRSGKKPGAEADEDLKKARWYLHRAATFRWIGGSYALSEPMKENVRKLIVQVMEADPISVLHAVLASWDEGDRSEARTMLMSFDVATKGRFIP